MLPTNRRVKKAGFPEIMKKGRFLAGENLYLRVSDQKTDSPTLFSFIVPNKVKKTSVGRHLIKRRLSYAVEKLLIQIKPGLACLIFAKKDVSALPYSQIEKEILLLLQKAKMLKELAI